MARASIPVDVFNPGQVFAALGFLELADVLHGDAEGGFDWTREGDTRFEVYSAGDENPFATVLRFLAECHVIAQTVAPPDGDIDTANAVEIGETFPASVPDRMALPISLRSNGLAFSVSHWADGSDRESFKLYAGNRTGFSIASDMLRGKQEKAKKGKQDSESRTLGVAQLWTQRGDELVARPFDVLTAMGGSFNLDPRGGWTAIDAGYSPNEHKDIAIVASPVVEILAACGLEHARPAIVKHRDVVYGAWAGLVPPVLARAALGGSDVALAIRRFRFTLGLAGKNKVVTFAREERSE
ncbi:MAG: type I-U CRISPR-associated protein Cas8c [Vicinamibacterales bacterium]